MHSLITIRRAIVGLCALACTAAAPHAHALTFVVNSADDGPAGPCDSTTVGGCTLREAIIAAVATAGRDMIRFDPTVFPLGDAPTPIAVGTGLPPIADPAGTVVDGAGASVVIVPNLIIAPTDGLAFTSTPGTPLANVTVANISVRGFDGMGVRICGGVPPACDQAVSATLVQNVVVSANEDGGIRIRGRAVTKTRIVDSVAFENGDVGIECDASESIAGTRIERCAARDSDGSGIRVGGNPGEISDTLITDSVAVRNTAGIAVAAFGHVTKTKLVNLGATANHSSGIVFITSGEASGLTIANTVATANESFGFEIIADRFTGVTLKDVVGNRNDAGIVVYADNAFTGAKVTNATAIGNEVDGIALYEPTGAKITRASVLGNGRYGLVVAGSGNVIKQVRGSENDDGAIRLERPGGGNRLERCSGSGNQGPGISIAEESTGNTIQKSVALGNDASDVVDENTPCANTWKANVFENRNGPCIN